MKRTLLTLMLLACGRTPAIETPVKPMPQPEQQPLTGCEGQAVVTLEGGRTLTRLTTEGATPLFSFATEGAVHWDVAASGHVAGHAYVSNNGPNDYRYEYVLLGRDGKVLFHEQRQEPHSPNVMLGADGWLSISAASGRLVSPEGVVTELGELQPMTARLPGGEVLVARGAPWEDGSPKFVWKSGALTPVTLPRYANLYVVGARVITVSGQALLSVLDGVSIALPVKDMSFVSQAAGRWVLLITGPEGVVVDLEAGTARKLTYVFEGTERYGQWSASLHSDGSVLADSVVGGALQLKRSTDLGATWSDVGEPMAMGEDFGLGRWLFPIERNGSVLMLSMSTGYGHYVNGLQLTSASGTHRLDTRRVYVNVDLQPGAADLSANGQCGAGWVADEPLQRFHLVFLDASGKTFEVRTATGFQPGWFKFLP